MSDSKTTIKELRDQLQKFKEDRNWEKFHDAKNLAEAISIEAGELQEHFLWKTSEDVNKQLAADPKFKEEVGEELADLFIFCLNFANSTDIDVATIVKDKIEKNNRKYPVEKAKNNSTKYDKL
jgi:NTP pyrophosphatase (non-canonical NTP hydrolase)